METLIEKEVTKNITEIIKKYEGNDKTQQYLKTLDRFKKLVENGFAKERGNTLKPINEKTKFNNNVIYNIALEK